MIEKESTLTFVRFIELRWFGIIRIGSSDSIILIRSLVMIAFGLKDWREDDLILLLFALVLFFGLLGLIGLSIFVAFGFKDWRDDDLLMLLFVPV